MKKLAVLLAVVAVAALSAPAFSATNPFMDVPMNHWAYDAIGQLAAHGILSGFPDGTYKGQQQTTRYEMASALARSLAVVDMTKASKQDVEMLKRLVVEFKDELEALGVRVDELDERVAVFENRLGGWHLHGTLVLDVKNESRNGAKEALGADGKGSVAFDEARIFFERTFGENDEYFFRARIRNEDGADGNDGSGAYFDRFYVDMPFFFDTQLTVGRFSWAWEGDYKISLPETGGWTGDQPLTDWTWTGFGLTKNFGLGTFNAVVSHPDKNWLKDVKKDAFNGDFDTWMFMARGTFQFTEHVGFDLGAQAFAGDNAEWSTKVDATSTTPAHYEGESFNSLWSIFGGLRFNFNDDIAFKGVYYYQKLKAEYIDSFGSGKWTDYTDDNASHWAVMLDVKQAALKFTSLWLEYGQYKKGFTGRNKSVMAYSDLVGNSIGQTAGEDIKYWRVGLGQEWNDQWATYLFYYGYDRDIAGNGAKPKEFGLGIQYKLNDYTTMGLNYIRADNDGLKYDGSDEDNVVRFRTKIAF